MPLSLSRQRSMADADDAGKLRPLSWPHKLQFACSKGTGQKSGLAQEAFELHLGSVGYQTYA
jgi:hypothetical protein